MRPLALGELYEYADALQYTWGKYLFNCKEKNIRPKLEIFLHLQRRYDNVTQIINKTFDWHKVTYQVVREVNNVIQR